ncbi:putative metal-dependent phosphohydrolase [Aquitalea magnusonii]|uniref:Putative metal-dependent phosphohydrolase n=1 Tax=Aquitalea magnusonii TaxID=332411 RepID=A0A3G9GJD6_9NEIS|nr:HD domain-containing phosphohydrolase [Aquitalea magnusonii]BBF87998.1 putative metal-dependent phosphohydrolase [Aquitalea magnusonii]
MPAAAATCSASADGSIHVDLREVIHALSDALDLVGIDDVAHGKRVGIMAFHCAGVLGQPRQQAGFMFDLGLLHDIGVSSTRTHQHLVSEFDWVGSQQHCISGAKLLASFAPLAAMALPVRYHHTQWDRLQAMQEVPQHIAEQANLIYLVDRVDALAAPYYQGGELLMHTAAIRQQIAQRRGVHFAPHLVDAFLSAAQAEAFWLQLEPRGIAGVLQDMCALRQPCTASTGQLKQLATLFSCIVDAKSPFTARHSLGVAGLSRWLAEKMGLPTARCEQLEIAALLHDLGKLRVPDEILDKPGGLDPHERSLINAHSFETYQILRHIHGFEEIACWAAYHHEEPDGNGYPFHLQAASMSVEARILRVADIFQALAQDRPYRAGLSAAEVLATLQRFADQQRIDPAVLALAASDMAGAMAAALPELSPQ